MEPAKTLEEEVVELLARKHLTVTTAESCTGRPDRRDPHKCGRGFGCVE